MLKNVTTNPTSSQFNSRNILAPYFFTTRQSRHAFVWFINTHLHLPACQAPSHLKGTSD